MQKPIEVTEELLTAEINQTLAALGTGEMSSVAYDTAWIARLAPYYPGRGFEEAIDWLRRNQHPDGSWGGKVLHYHDRIISTLAAIVALRSVGETRDMRRIEQGETFLWRENGRLHQDANDTAAFSVLTVSLINEAITLGLDVPRDLYADAATIEKKLNILSSDSKLWRKTSMIFSLEAIRSYFPDKPDFFESNGSVGASPAATAAALLQAKYPNAEAVNYLQSAIQPDGGLPNSLPIDTFEIFWVLDHLRLAGAVSPDHPDVQRALKSLLKAWSPERGVSYSSFFPVPDADSTAMAFCIARWGGRDMDINVFQSYVEGDHFCTFPRETDPSLSTNIHVLEALQTEESSAQRDLWIKGIIAMLRRCAVNGQFWFDKWHISPYYTTCAAIRPLYHIGDDLVKPRIQWIKRTQREDGGWGYFGVSTPEETAYCLQSLLFWDRTVERINQTTLDMAAQFLLDHLDDRKPIPLWIAKCLFSPLLIIRAAVLSALYSYMIH